MRSPSNLVQQIYGDKILHLVVLAAALGLAAYTISVLGIQNLFNPTVWWQSIAVWFAVAVIGHDLVLFPLYALAERLLPRQRTRGRVARTEPRRVPLVNYIRMPTMATGLTFVLFYPGIVEQGAFTYNAATGLTQEPFLTRWLLLTAGFYSTAAVCYLARIMSLHRKSPAPVTPLSSEAVPEPSAVGGGTPEKQCGVVQNGEGPRESDVRGGHQ